MADRKKHECQNTEPRIGRAVTDGKIIYKNYQWRGDQIYSFWARKFINYYLIGRVYCYSLKEGEKIYSRSRQQLYMHSHPEEFLPKDYDKWIDVYGYEKYFCFNPQNPNQIWSKTFLRLIKVHKNNNKHSRHLLFNATINGTHRKTLYVHKMVWQSYFKKKIKRGFVIHHLNHDSFDNRIQNMLLLPREVHSKFEVFYNVYKHKSDFYIVSMTKDELIEKIYDFDISEEDQQKLINSL